MPATAIAVANVLYAALQWVQLTVVARYFGPSSTGDLTLAFSLTAPVFVLGSLQLRLVAATDPHALARLEEYVKLRSRASLAALSVSICATALLAASWHVFRVAVLIALCKSLEHFGDLAAAVYQLKSNLSRLVVSQLARGSAAVASLMLGAWLGLGLEICLVLWTIAWLVLVVLIDGPHLIVRRKVECGGGVVGRRRWHLDRAILATGLALGLAAFFNSLATSLPRVWLGSVAPPDSLGQFGVVAYFVAAASVVLAAAAQGFAPQFALEDTRRREYSSLYLRVVGVSLGSALVVALVLCLYADRLVVLLFGPAFGPAAKILRIAVWALPLYAVAVIGNLVAVAKRRGVQQAVVYASTLAVVALVLFVGMGEDPTKRAAWAVVIGAAAQALVVTAGLRVGRTRSVA